MYWVYVSVIGVALGSALGWTAEQVRVAPLVQSVAAFLMALVIGDAATMVWAANRSGGPFYLGVGIENLFYVSLLCVVAGAVHLGLSALADSWCPALSNYRAAIVGSAGGLCGTVSGVVAMRALMSMSV